MGGPAGGAVRAPRDFYARTASMLAPALLGARLVRVMPDGTRISGRIVETEAYEGTRDRGSHAFGGRRTARNEAMYAPPGTSYVYFTYGMHHCMNVVCGRAGDPRAVLIRALEPLEGLEAMRHARSTPGKPRSGLMRDVDLCSGPGKLCRALSIDRACNGRDMTLDLEVWIELEVPMVPLALARGPRIGLGEVGEWREKPLRWGVQGSRCLSAPFPVGGEAKLPRADAVPSRQAKSARSRSGEGR